MIDFWKIIAYSVDAAWPEQVLKVIKNDLLAPTQKPQKSTSVVAVVFDDLIDDD